MDIENWNTICRLCIREKPENKLVNIWNKQGKTVVSDLIKNVAQLKITEDDLLPPHVCNSCINQLESIKQRIDFYLKNDQKLRKILKEKDIADEIKDEPDPTEKSNVLGSIEAFIEHVEVKEEILIEEEIENTSNSAEKEIFRSSDSLEVKPQRCTRRAMYPKTTEILNFDEPVTKRSKCSDDEEDYRRSNSPSGSESEDDSEPEEKKLQVKKKLPRGQRQKRNTKGAPKKRRIRRQYPDAPLHNDNKCYVCNTQLESATAYFEHLFVHSDMIPFSCDKCIVDKVVIKQVKSLATHFKMHVRPVKCDYCDKRFNDDKAKDFHIEYTHLNKSGKTTCEHCSQVFESALRCTYHINKVHLIKFPCPHCNKPFGAKDLLGTHIKRVHENRLEIFECSTCGAKLKGNESFLAHLRKMHGNDLKYKCNLCGKAYLHQSLLNHHLNLHASKPGYKFIPKRNYNEYYNVKTDEQTQNTMMECKECLEIVDNDPKRMRLHASTHIKPYTCTFCGKGFSKQEECQDHENTHTGAKPHTCEFCGQNFISRYKLRTHHRNKHSEKMPFHCSKCSTAFKIEQTLKLHEKKCFAK